jgi:hypothetical protein
MSSSPILIGTLKEVGGGFIVLSPNLNIIFPQGMTAPELVLGERLMVTARNREGNWVAEKIERYPR